jgi:hypothetical protein
MKLGAEVSDKHYQVVYKETYADPYPAAFSTTTFTEAKEKYDEYKGKYYYYVSLQEIIVVTNVVEEFSCDEVGLRK